ncbi:hypothetical protein DVR12_06330 [Chitinophaga silvatica]|uniref:Uncharacterized protein n=1 Tax=Chitinophaga silvatica TaxID=2282649 RepID=A0A3E1YE74_9BACT|nr:hypothetical protein [Chitinophaga silvatica]RFS24808.1 hypothetical protein DVR12_06330 [Chitinophaga silvatica]
MFKFLDKIESFIFRPVKFKDEPPNYPGVDNSLVIICYPDIVWEGSSKIISTPPKYPEAFLAMQREKEKEKEKEKEREGK